MASRCPLTDFDLLVGVLKPFAQIASFYATGKHPDAVNARKSLEPTDTYYEKLSMELNCLYPHISKLGPATGTKTVTPKEMTDNLSSVLDMLDEAISNKLHESYTCLKFEPSRHNLHAFYHLVKSTAAAGSNVLGKSNTHVKSSAHIKSNAQSGSNAPIRSNTPIRSNAATKSNAPIRTNAHVKLNAPTTSNTLVRSYPPVRSSAPANSSAPAKSNAPAKRKIHDFKNYINLQLEPKEIRDRLVACLAKMNKGFAADPLGQVRKAAITPVIADLDQSKPSLHQVPCTIHDQAERIYSLLTEHWKCKRHKPHTAAKLRLYTYRKLGEKIRFEVFFTIPRAPESQNEWWQESIVVAILDKSDTESLVETANQAAHPGNKSMSVHVQLPKTEGEPLESWHEPLGPGDEPLEFGDETQESGDETPESKDEEPKVPSGICSLIKIHADMGSQRLRLGMNKKGLHYYYPKRASQDVNIGRTVTLETLIEEGDPCLMEEIKTQPKAMLQVILANALLQFTGSSWVPPIWNKAHICFFLPADADIPDLSRPYFSTQCCNCPKDGTKKAAQDATKDSSEKGTTKKVKQMPCGHPCPSLLALGIILLEIERGESIEIWRPKDTNRPKINNNRNHHYHIDADIPAAERMLDECYQNSHNHFSEAVRACINADSFTDEFGRNQTLSDSRFRQVVFENIVLKLEDVLKTVWDGSTEKLDEFCSAIKPASKSQKRSTQKRCKFSAARNSTRQKAEKDAAITRTEEIGEDVYHTPEARSGADKWFKDLDALVHKPLGLLPNNPEEVPKEIPKERLFSHTRTEQIFGTKRSNKGPNKGRIRVGIIDTGFDPPVSALAAFDGDGERIKGCWSFFDGDGKPAMIEEFKDLDGHGTHGATLILKVAPQAELFVARVFQKKEESTPGVEASHIHERIARAIYHAVDKWEVDVISMSFGFHSRFPIVEEAINEAAKKNVIMLAAPGNWGGQHKAAWPARQDQVIDIYATDHFANRCGFTPTPPKDSEGFATLGNAVESYWSESCEDGVLKRKSGTSVATAIAAGLAALVLDYVKILINEIGDKIEDDDVDIFKQIRTAAGMKAMFQHMVIEERDGYRFLGPWHYFGSGRAVFREEQTVIPFTFLRDMLLKN